MKFKKFLAVCTTALLAFGLAGLGAVSASAVDLVGTVGDLQPWSEPTNHASFWGATCVDGDSTNGSITDATMTVTLNSSQNWTLLVIKGGSTYNDVISNPQPGVAYASPPDDKNQKAVSHWIVCFTPTPPPTPKDATATATAGAATCQAAGGVTFGIANATWENNTDLTDGSRTAIANDGHLFSNGESTMVVTYTIAAQLTGEQCATSTPKDATASAMVGTATCLAAGGVTFGIANATWENNTDLTDGSRTAIANNGHLFANGESTLVVTYTIAAQLTGEQCAQPPCLPNSAVSYTYNYTTNGGVITVASMDNHSRTLCNPFWVTAASWTFDGNTMWPQTLDKWNPANGGYGIATVGTYAYGADVTCGQGDIYATFNTAGVIKPNPEILNGHSDPYAEFFLHQMGFTGPNPTYMVQDASSCNPVTAGVTFKGYTCNEFAPLTLNGTHVTFTVKYDDAVPATSVSGVVPGDYNLVADFAAQTGAQYFGQITVTVQPDAGYTLLSEGTPVPLTADTRIPSIVKAAPTMQTTWVLAANLPQDCPVPVAVVPAATFNDVCGIANDSFNAPSDTAEIDYTVTDNRVNGIGSVVVTAAPKTGFYFADGAYSGAWSHTFTKDDCVADNFGDPYAVDQTCSEVEEGATLTGYIWVDLSGNLANEISYQIVGGTYDYTATQEINNLPPGDYTVTVTAKDGFMLNTNRQSVWNFTIGAVETCTLITHPLVSTTATSTNITCNGAGSYTLANTEGVVWFVDGSTTPTAPGTYKVTDPTTVNVRAEVLAPDYGWEQDAQTAWTFDFTNPVDCIPTLAFTGSDGGNLGLLLAGGFLLFGGTIVAFERRFRTNAR